MAWSPQKSHNEIVSEFIFYFLAYLAFVGFLGAVLTRSDRFPGISTEGSYPETLIFWVIGISAILAFFSVASN